MNGHSFRPFSLVPSRRCEETVKLRLGSALGSGTRRHKKALADGAARAERGAMDSVRS